MLDITREEEVLGGAANVAANAAALGAAVRLFGVVGRDADAATLKKLLAKRKIAADGLTPETGRPTTRKTRFMALRQQMLRVDREERRPVSDDTEKGLLAKIEKRLPSCDGVILSDYAKGTLTPTLIRSIIDAATKLGKPVVVDPKGREYRRYAGATLITPNKKEAAEASGLSIASDADYTTVAKKLFRDAKVERILITRGPEGMSLFSPGQKPLTLPAEALEVFDVSGAGDTVVAAVATYHFAGLPLEEAARIANVAAAIEVTHVGAKAVSKEEILERLTDGEEVEASKIMSAARAAAFVARLKEKGETVVFTNGCFDLLHAGHVDYLQKARAMGDALVVGLNTDRSVRRLKGSRRPLAPQGDRAEVLAALACVDGVVLFDDETPARLIDRLIPSILVKGGDYHRDTVVGAETVEKHGGSVKIVPLKKGRSSSSIIDLILQRYQP